MKKVISLLLTIFYSIIVWSANDDVFTASTKEGVLMTFRVLDEADKVCQIGNGYNSSIPKSTTGVITIPSMANEYHVVCFGSKAFDGCVNLSSVIIPNSITSIGSYTFAGCTGLTSVMIPNSITNIRIGAFNNCSGLSSITIPNSVSSIEPEAFANCNGLEEIRSEIFNPFSISDNVFSGISSNAKLIIPKWTKAKYQASFGWTINFKEIVEEGGGDSSPKISFADANVKAICVANWDIDGDSDLSEDEAAVVKNLGTVFKENNQITSFMELVYFTGLKSISSEAFIRCKNLTSVALPNSLSLIDFLAFCGCESLTSVTIPPSVTSIGNSSFLACRGLTSIMIPNSVTSIGDGAFQDCSGLTSITIPNSVTSISGITFAGCSGLTSITVSDGNPKYDSRNNSNAIIETSSNTLITGCKNTVIPNSVTSIGNFAFYYCTGLTSITIPNSVTSIGNSAFNSCSKLAEVISEIQNPFEIDNSVFNTKSTDAVLYVPIGTKAKYQALSGWTSNFKEIIEEEGDSSPLITFADANVKAICVAKWDTNGDGELSEEEAAAVKDLGNVFKNTTAITSFDELRYFGISIIGSDAFRVCSGLTSVTIPSSVTSIGDFAFYYCSDLTSVTIPSSLTSIGESAFDGCRSLTTLTIPSSVTSIGESAFNNCSGLTTITVDSKNKKYDSRDNCNAIIETASNTLIAGCKNTIIPNSVTSIGWYAFYGCSSLTSVTIPSSVTSIGQQAFLKCSGLTSVTIPSSVTSIGNYAFSECSGLTSINVDSKNKRYDSRDNCNAIIETSAKTLIAGCKSTIIPNFVTRIGICAFSGCSGLTSVSIPSSVTSIGDDAFLGCSGLTSVTIPSSVRSIGYQAFADCSGLTSVTIPSSVTSIHSEAFYRCSGLTSVSVDISQPLKIESSTFSSRKKATLYVPAGSKAAYMAAAYWKEFKEIIEKGGDSSPLITFADANVKAICVANWDTNGDGELSEEEAAAVKDLGNVFKNTTAITSFDELRYFDITIIGDSAFYNCRGLTSVVIPSSVTNIGVSAFQYCSHLTSVTIPSNVTIIGNYAFNYCSGLTSITIPSSVTRIGFCAFSDCSGLTSIDVDSRNNTYDSRDNCNAIIETASNTLIVGCKNTIIPNSVTNIGEYAFYGCYGLSSVTIPSSVMSIGDNAFFGTTWYDSQPDGLVYAGKIAYKYKGTIPQNSAITLKEGTTGIAIGAFSGCSGLTSVTIPSSVTSIGREAFQKCSSLTSAIVDISQPLKIEYYTFSNRKNATLYVPAGSKTAYESAAYWKEFREIIEIESNTKQFTLSITSIGNGSVTYNDTTVKGNTNLFTVNEGTYATIIFTPDDGYRVKFVKVNGSDVTSSISNNKYTIRDITENTSVEVEFEEEINLLVDNYPPQYAQFDLYNDRIVFETNWSQFSDYILSEKLDSMTKEEFDANYEADIKATNCETNPNGESIHYLYIYKQPKLGTPENIIVDKLGIVKYNSHPARKNDYTFAWYLWAGELEEVTHDRIWYPVEITRYIRFKEKTGISPRPKYSYIYVKMTAHLNRKSVSVRFTTKDGNYWYDLDGTENGWDAIVFDVKESTNESIVPNYYDIRTTLVDNTVSIKQLYKYYFAPKNEQIKAQNGKEYTITAQPSANDISWNHLYCMYIRDSHQWDEKTLDDIIDKCAINYNQGVFTNDKLYACYNGTYTQIATLNQSTGEITLIDNEQCKDILNATGYSGNRSNINTGMRTWVAVVATNSRQSDYAVASKVSYENASEGLRSFLVAWQRTAPSFTLSVKSTGNGSITYEGTDIRNTTNTFTISEGVSATVIIVPDNCHKIKSLKVNGSDVTASVSDNKYTISNINKDTTVEVEYEVENLTQKSIVFDFNNPTKLNPPITPSSDNAGIVNVTRYVFTNGPVSISFVAGPQPIGAQIFTFIDDTRSQTSYSLRVTSTTTMTISIGGGAVLDSIRISDDSTIGDLHLVTGEPGEMDPYQMYKFWKSDTKTCTEVSFCVSSYPTLIRKMTVYYSVPMEDIIMGDSNGDGEVNVADIVEIVNYILEKPSEIFVMEAADMNGDGEVNVTDVVMVVSIIMTDQSNAARSMDNMAEVATDDDWLTLTEDRGRRLALSLENRGGYVASQFDVRVSDGHTIDEISLNGERSNGHLLTYAKTADNIYKVVVYSLGNEVFAGNSGELINFEVTGNGIVSIENIVFVTAGHQEKRFPPLNTGTSTAVEVIDHSPFTIDHYYDLQGRRVTNGQRRKGVYIRNSKKHVVR